MTMEGTTKTLDVGITIAEDQIDMRTIDQKGIRDRKEKIDRQDRKDRRGLNATIGLNQLRSPKDCRSTELSCLVSHIKSGTDK